MASIFLGLYVFSDERAASRYRNMSELIVYLYSELDDQFIIQAYFANIKGKTEMSLAL